MNSPDRIRESIWSVPHGWRTTYFLTFSVSNLTATSAIVIDEIVSRGDADPITVFSAVAERVAVSGVALAITIFSVLEVLSFAMIAADYFRRKYLEPLKEGQREEGRAEANAEWHAWYARLLKAKSAGVPFDEPTPTERRR